MTAAQALLHACEPSCWRSHLCTGLADKHSVFDVVGYMQATHHHGDVLVATSEWFGEGDARLPSIYWAVVDPSPNLCKLTVERRGVVASEDGLALAYPSIAAHAQGGVILAYSYAGNTTVTLDGVSYPAYAGERGSSCRFGPDGTCASVQKCTGVLTEMPK